MASQEPYSGTPQVAPALSPTPSEHIDAPISAFGGATAAATQHLGQTEDSVGNELFQRSIAMQTLKQTADANNAVADYTDQLGKMHADYTATMGKNAVDGLDPYIEQTEKLRAQYKDGLDSPLAQRMFDQESRNIRGRAVWSAAGHAGDQNKAYVLGSLKARDDSANNASLTNPTDEAGFQQNLVDLKGRVNQQATIRGWSQEQTDAALQSSTSDLWSSRITGLVKSQPLAAQKLLDQAQKSGSIVGPEYGRLQDLVTGQMRTVQTRNIGSSVLAGDDGRFGEGIVDKATARTGIKAIESSGGNYSVIGPDVKGDHALGAYQVMGNNLQPWLKEAGMASMSQQEFLTNHAAQDQLFDFKFGQYMQQYGSANKAALAWFTGSPNPDPNASDGGTTAKQYVQKFNAAIANSAPLGSLVSAAKARAAEQSPNDPLLPDFAEQRIEAMHNEQVRIQKDAEFNNKQTVESGLINGGQGGKLPTTVEDLKAQDPKIAASWDAMQPSDQRRYMRVLAQNAKGDMAWDEDKLKTYQQLIGMRQNNPDEFLQTDVISADLPISARRKLVDMQAEVNKQAGANPVTTHAMSVLQPMTDPIGLNRKQDKEGYNQLTGAMHDQIAQFQAENKRAPKDDEIQVMGARLLQRQNVHWYSSGTEMFRSPVPDEAAKIIAADPTWKKIGIEPTDEQIRRIYIQRQYQELYGKKTQSASAKPEVPTSR